MRARAQGRAIDADTSFRASSAVWPSSRTVDREPLATSDRLPLADGTAGSPASEWAVVPPPREPEADATDAPARCGLRAWDVDAHAGRAGGIRTVASRPRPVSEDVGNSAAGPATRRGTPRSRAGVGEGAAVRGRLVHAGDRRVHCEAPQHSGIRCVPTRAASRTGAARIGIDLGVRTDRQSSPRCLARFIGPAVERVRLRSTGTLRAHADAAGFGFTRDADLRPFLFPPIPRASILIGIPPEGG